MRERKLSIVIVEEVYIACIFEAIDGEMSQYLHRSEEEAQG